MEKSLLALNILESSILQFLSQYVCAKKKPNKFKRFVSNSKHISATYPPELVCIDLYFYNGRLYFTLIDVFSGFPFCIQVYSKESTQVKLAFDKFCDAYAAPHKILSDNGGEFSLIPNCIMNPSDLKDHKQMEKSSVSHQELGKISRIHSVFPDEAVLFLQTELKKALFLNGI